MQVIIHKTDGKALTIQANHSITEQQIAWFKAGAACVGAGASLVSKEAMAKKDWPAITQSAKAFVEAIRAARAK